MKRIAKIAIAATLLLGVGIGISHFSAAPDGSAAFAQILEQIEKAKTITWKVTRYRYFSHGDGKGTWVPVEEEHAYKAPGVYREVMMTVEEKNPEKYVMITDEVNKKELTLWPKNKKAYLEEIATQGHNPEGPFDLNYKHMKEANLQWVGRKKTLAGEVNVFRNPSDSGGRYWSYDLWIDPKTKQLVGKQIPGADIYDPDNDPGRDNPIGENWPNGSPTCTIMYDVNFDAELDDSLFSFEPPEGYTVHVQKRNYVTEQEMIDWIGILANLNNKTFPGRTRPNKLSFDGPSRDRREQIYGKPEEERTAAELKYTKAITHYVRANLNHMPLYHFISDNVVKNSFRYFGKGVKLGDKNAIVCWYKLKGAQTYRVVYGDLSVKDVARQELPLPVEVKQ